MGAVARDESRKAHELFRIDDVLVDSLHLELRGADGKTVSVQRKPLEVLLYLVDHHPRLVTREELIGKVWTGNAYVGEKALTNAIWQLRTSFEGLGVSGLILTVRKRGYRLGIEPVAEVPADEAPAGAGLTPPTVPARRFRLPHLLALLAAGAMVAGICAYFLLGNVAPAGRESAVAAADPVNLSSGLGRARFAALSPDESRLAYVWRPYGGDENVYYQRLDEPGVQQQLTFSDSRKGRVTWDHSGRYVIVPQDDSSGQCDFVAIDVATRTERVLTDCRRSGTTYLAAHPHRSELYFTGRDEDGSNLYLMRWDGEETDVSVVPCALHCEHPARDVSVSPDGRYLALTRRIHRFSEDLYVRDLHSGEERRLTTDQHDIIGVAWHPDGRRIIMAAIHSGSRNGYLVDIRSGEQVPLDIENFGHPSRVASDGTVYFHTIESQVQLSYLGGLGEAPSALFPLTLSQFQYRDPHLNPATGEFAFVSNRSGHSELWIADPDLVNPMQATNVESVVRHPRWSHDGRHIAFVARFPQEQHDVLSLLEVATGRVERLYTFERVLGRPTWWHDDSAIIFRENGNLQRLDLATGEMAPLTARGGIYAQVPEDGSLYFTRGTNRGLWKKLPDGTSSEVLDGEAFGTRYSWVATSSGIYYYDQKSSPGIVHFLDFTTGTSTGVLAIPPELVTVQSTFAYDALRSRLIIDSWRPRSTIVGITHPMLGIAD